MLNRPDNLSSVFIMSWFVSYFCIISVGKNSNLNNKGGVKPPLFYMLEVSRKYWLCLVLLFMLAEHNIIFVVNCPWPQIPRLLHHLSLFFLLRLRVAELVRPGRPVQKQTVFLPPLHKALCLIPGWWCPGFQSPSLSHLHLRL